MTEPLLPDESFSVTRTLEALAAAKRHANKRRCIRETIPCPVCKGDLVYSVASNGHMWGKCRTEGCVEWIE